MIESFDPLLQWYRYGGTPSDACTVKVPSGVLVQVAKVLVKSKFNPPSIVESILLSYLDSPGTVFTIYP